jgi:hypothetical protein
MAWHGMYERLRWLESTCLPPSAPAYRITPKDLVNHLVQELKNDVVRQCISVIKGP